MKNLGYFLIGILISSSISVSAYYVKDIIDPVSKDEQNLEKILDVKSFEYKTATSTFQTQSDYDQAKYNYENNKEITDRLDIIIRLLRTK